MSKKYKFGEIVGIFVGVTIGAVVANYIVNAMFGKSKDQAAYQVNYPVDQGQYGQPVAQQGVFEQALSNQQSTSQNRLY